MKSIKCSQVGGGTCAFEVKSDSVEDAKMQMGVHAKEHHADMVAAATPESMIEWNKMFDQVWEEAPTV